MEGLPDIFIGRQPIFNGELNVVAYELLYRSDTENVAKVVDQKLATMTVLNNTFAEFGLEQLVGTNPAYINVERDYLLNKDRPPLPQESIVLEILEGVVIDDDVYDAVRTLKQEQYTIALDDFVFSSEYEPMFHLVDIIKIDVRQLTVPAIHSHVQRLRPLGVKLLAEKIESEAEFERLRDMGFSLFQGHFLEEPKVISGRRFSPNQINMLQLLEALQRPEPDISEIEKLVSRDVALSYKILKLINSVAVGLPIRIDSIGQAIVHLGLIEIKSWVSLLLLSTVDHRPSELTHNALVRARMCELLAKENGAANVDSYFTVGLFSNLDALLQTPMQELLPNLPLTAEIKDALISADTDIGKALECAKTCEQMDLPEVNYGGLSRAKLQSFYSEAIAWSQGVQRELHPESHAIAV